MDSCELNNKFRLYGLNYLFYLFILLLLVVILTDYLLLLVQRGRVDLFIILLLALVGCLASRLIVWVGLSLDGI